MIYHPITGELVKIDSIKDNELFIDDRLFKPASWGAFYTEGEDKENTRTFGIEIELNMTNKSFANKRTKADVCRTLLAELNKEGRHFHIMRDGSVRNGIELVSAPMSYQYFNETFDFEAINVIINELGLIATHDTGLHIHVGMQHSLRDRLSILKLFSITYPLWIVKARRRIIRLEERYVSTDYMINNKQLLARHVANLKALAKNGTSKVSFKDIDFHNYNFKNRYYAVNFTNSSTVEFRYFAGTNDFNVIYNYLTFVAKFIQLHDDIANNKLGYINDLDSAAKAADLVEQMEFTSRVIKRMDLLFDSDRLYYNHFYSFNTYWHQTSIKEVIAGDYVIAKDKYQDYLKLIKKAQKSINRFSIDTLAQTEEYINDLLLVELYEVAIIDEDTIDVCPIVHTTNLTTLNKSDFNSKYIALKPRNRSLLYDKLED